MANAEDEERMNNLMVADKKIKLIDIMSPDHDFLLSTPFSHTSLSSGRPSLAWDAALSDGFGVLEQDELSVINQGFHITPQSQPKALEQVGPYSRNKLHRHNQNSIRKGSNIMTADKLTKEGSCGNSLMKLNRRDLQGKQHYAKKTENNAASGKGLCKPKTSANSRISIDISSQTFSSHGKRKPESRKSGLSASFSASQIWRSSERIKAKNMSPPSKRGAKFEIRSLSCNEAKGGLNFVCQQSWDAIKSPAAAHLRSSGLRAPSPKIGFFDEKTSSYGKPSTRTPNEVESEGISFLNKSHDLASPNTILYPGSTSRKHRTTHTDGTRNVKRSKTTHMNSLCSIKGIKETHPTKNKGNYVGQKKISKCNPEENEKNKSRDSRDELVNLSRCFETINLNNDIQQTPLTTSSTRTPLADKTYFISNSTSAALRLQQKGNFKINHPSYVGN